MSDVLSVDGLYIERNRQPVVHGVTFSAARGERVALMGPSGAGKTTLLRAIAGLESTARGVISVSNRGGGHLRHDPFTVSPASAVGMVFQFHHLFEHLTAIQNVTLAPVHVARVPVDAAARRAKELLDQLGVGHRMHARPHELSGGEAQRVAIARALAMEPSLLLMDEPTASLDQARRDELAATVRQLSEDGTTILISTHDASFATACVTRVLLLNDGRIVREGRPADVLS